MKSKNTETTNELKNPKVFNENKSNDSKFSSSAVKT